VNHADWITSITFCPSDPKYFASTSLDGIVKIWQYGVNKEVKSIDLSGHGGIWKAEFTQDGQYICVCCQDGTIGLIHFVN
jgi:WD40 repeat protein